MARRYRERSRLFRKSSGRDQILRSSDVSTANGLFTSCSSAPQEGSSSKHIQFDHGCRLFEFGSSTTDRFPAASPSSLSWAFSGSTISSSPQIFGAKRRDFFYRSKYNYNVLGRSHFHDQSLRSSYHPYRSFNALCDRDYTRVVPQSIRFSTTSDGCGSEVMSAGEIIRLGDSSARGMNHRADHNQQDDGDESLKRKDVPFIDFLGVGISSSLNS
ncbi:putative transcription factor MYB54-like [Cocos nucifera]|uniref:Putative transcription factor MYB54-like n=1 Tax=Cocos nucifera TaxID=13894 RepID=A0A8K0HZ89_COCNU|nr:putative transcription factor MYB54-like [Cocos nucifera]